MKFQLKDLIQRVLIKNNTLPQLLTHVIDVYDGILDKPSRDASQSRRLGSYQVVAPKQLVLGTPALNRKLQCAINLTDSNCIANIADIVFSVNEEVVLPEYMHMYLNSIALRPDIAAKLVDKKFNFTIEQLLEITIDIPDLAIQTSYLDVYYGILGALDSSCQGLEQIKQASNLALRTLDAPRHELGNYVTYLQQQFATSEQEPIAEEVEEGDMQVVPAYGFYYKNAFGSGQISLRFNNQAMPILVPIGTHIVFYISETRKFDPWYLFALLNSEAVQQFIITKQQGKVVKRIAYTDLVQVTVPVPSLEQQQTLARIFKLYWYRRELYWELVRDFQKLCAIYCLEQTTATK